MTSGRADPLEVLRAIADIAPQQHPFQLVVAEHQPSIMPVKRVKGGMGLSAIAAV
ncbi:hypothetical protein SM39_1883 [Serratia marcescens SM39]|uniref:Uncharacterized protein n=1 Tax=Serratia marcescens SM39 TaxID=1334564 RepID=A0AAT9EMS5_SERMA|nr:hypothetical protein SM39_1883 [Serratia marcescens SM39]